MLARFSVSNYRSFSGKITLDLTSGMFDFNNDSVDNGVVKNAIVYGKNGVGKSNLGVAIFDLVTHLTEHNKLPDQLTNIVNLDSNEKNANFSYEFKFGKNQVFYEYSKNSSGQLIKEKLTLNKNDVIYFDSSEKQKKIQISLVGTENLNRDVSNAPNISIINYVKNNSILDQRNKENKLFLNFIDYVNNMLYFRSLRDNSYIGYESGKTKILLDIIEKNHIEEFQALLNEGGIECELVPVQNLNEQRLGFKFKNGTVDFFDIASTGTVALTTFYFWLQRIKSNAEPFLVFIDEFDAFYHFELAELIINKLKETNKQVILTTHNTNVMTNELLRPDCYFILTKDKISSVNKCTDKELREAHNLAKLYRSGSFDCGR